MALGFIGLYRLYYSRDDPAGSWLGNYHLILGSEVGFSSSFHSKFHLDL